MNWYSYVRGLLISTIAMAGSALASSGDVAWDAQKNLMKDAQGRLYYQPTPPSYELTRIRESDGSALWTKALSSTTYVDSNCTDADRIFVLADKTLYAINPEGGQTLWSYQYEGPGYATLSCVARSNDIYLNVGDVANQVIAISKYSGLKAWEYNPGAYVYIFNADWQNVYLNRSDNGVNTVVALTQWNGQHHWTQQLEQDQFALSSPEGHVYTMARTTLRRISPNDGRSLWTYQGSGDYAYAEFGSNGQLYLHEMNNRLLRISPDSGYVEWTYNLENNSGVSTYTQLLKSGDFIVRSQYLEQNRARNVYLAMNGSVRWENWVGTVPYSPGYVAEDSAQNLYNIGQRSLTAMNRDNGSIRWTFDLQVEPNQVIFQIVGEGENLYLTYGYPVKYGSMGLARINSETGSLYWQKYLAMPFNVVDWDNERVYVASYLTGRSQAIQR